MFDDLSNLKVLILRQVNLNSMNDIKFTSFRYLTKLDLSFNNLSSVDQVSFENKYLLEYLDQSFNQIDDLDANIFLYMCNSLVYLNLENNRIDFIGSTFNEFYKLEIFKIANNRLIHFVYFVNHWNRILTSNLVSDIYLNNNRIVSIDYFSYLMTNPEVLNYDTNEISFIEDEAFLNCRLLKRLSISHNKLTRININDFYYLFSLKYLNLSFNRIHTIEPNSFQNVNKLLELDLSFNNFHVIDHEIFFGLTFLI